MPVTTADRLLASLLPDWQLRLQGWASDGSLVAAAQEALLLPSVPQALQDLLKQWIAGDFTGLPPIVLLSSADINGALGAYAISTGTIYLNADWLAGATKEQVFAVLTEELGHHLDGLLNAVDTPGDEGEYFARLLSGQSFSYSEKGALRLQSDGGVVKSDAQSIQAEQAIALTAPAITLWGNSLYYRLDLNNETWYSASIKAESIGGYLASIDSQAEQNYISNTLGIHFSQLMTGLNDLNVDGTYIKPDGSPITYSNFLPGYPNPWGMDQPTAYALVITRTYFNPWEYNWTTGQWYSAEAAVLYNTAYIDPISGEPGIGVYAEVPIASSLTFSATPREGAGLFTTTINLSAGTQTSGNLAEGAQVYWKVSGITADDLDSGALTGTGVITNGQLQIQHSLKVDSDSGESFQVSVFSDASLAAEYQIGSTQSVAIAERVSVRGNSLYTIVDGPSWTQAEANSVKLGGHLTAISNEGEKQFIYSRFGFGGIFNTGFTKAWIGLTDKGADRGRYYWTNGDSYSFSEWLPGKPSLEDLSKEFSFINLPNTNLGPDNSGYWVDWYDYPDGNSTKGLAEIPFIRRGDSAYVIVQGPTWEEAEANAVRLGGHLVTINDAAENDFLYSTYNINKNNPAESVNIYYWTGLTDSRIEGTWEWISGETSTYRNWAPGEPSNGSNSPQGEDFAHLGWDNGWNDFPSQGTIPYYAPMLSRHVGIAEIKLAPNNNPTGSPTLSGTYKTGQVITIDKTPIQDADNFTGYTPNYNYSWEVSSNSGVTWTQLTSADATDNNTTYTLTSADVGKQVRGRVSYLDGYGTQESVESNASIVIEYATPDFNQDNILLITGSGTGSIDGIPFNSSTVDLGLGTDTATLTDGAGTTAALTLIGGAGFDRLNGNASANNLILTGLDQGTLDLVSFSSIENIYLEGGNDTVTIQAGGRLSGILDGGAGNNTLTVDGTYTIGIGSGGTIVIDNGSGGGGSFSGFQTIQGGGGNSGGGGGGTPQSNSLALNASSNTVAITGPNSGTADGTAFTNISDINLAAGDDNAILAAVGSLTGTLSGGTGSDDLTLNAAVNTVVLSQSGVGTATNSGNAVSTAFNGFEIIRLDAGNDTADLDLNGTTALTTKRQLRLDGGLGNDQLTLRLNAQERQNLIATNQLAALQSYINNPTGQTHNLSLLEVDLVLTNFESGVLITPNQAPTDLTLTSSGITENSAAGTVIGTLDATDPDAGSTFTYALVAGNGTNDADNALVEIVGNQVRVKSGALIDFETNPTLNLNIQVTDNGTPGLTYTKAVTAAVLNQQEAGSLGAITSSSSGVFQEGVTLTAGLLSDPDTITTTPTYTWYRGTTVVQTGSSNSYAVGPLGEGSYRVEASYTDGTGSSVTASSAAQLITKINNGQGTLSAITSSTPGVFQEGVTLTAGAISGDPDGNGTITAYQWHRNGTAISGATTASYLVPTGGAGAYTVALTYSDGQSFSTTITSAAQQVAATPFLPDITPPNINSITVQGTSIILNLSEPVSALTIPASAFLVQTVTVTPTLTTIATRTISNISLDQNNANLIILSLTGSAPSAASNLWVSYNDPAGDQSTGVVQDLAGNDLATTPTPLNATTFSTALTAASLAANYTNLILTGTTAINGTGNANANTITGNSAINVITGGAGIDTMDGGGGSDLYLLASSSEHTAAEIQDSGNTPGEIDELRFASVTPNDTLTVFAADTGLERVVIGTGTAAAAVTTGSTALNINASAAVNGLTIIGNNGANALTGTAFADTINGNAGNDSMNGGAGSDIYLIAASTEHTTAEIQDTGSTPGEIDELRFTSTTANQTLTVFAGDTGLERVVIGTGTAAAAVTTGSTALNINASAATNGLTISGNNGANALTGTAFADTINGNAGNDSITGNAGDDILNGGLGNDTMNGGAGSDIYLIATNAEHSIAEIADTGTTGSDELRFTSTTANQTLTVFAADTGLEQIIIGTGTAATAVTTGSTALNINAAAAVNALSITGNNGNNTLTGTSFADIINGNDGNDTIIGHLGNDTLTGGAGADIFRFASALNGTTNVDLITDFTATADVSTTDRIQLENTGVGLFNALPVGTIAAAAFTTAAYATAAQRIRYDASTGNLFYDADGNGAIASILFATLSPNLSTLNNNHFVVT